MYVEMSMVTLEIPLNPVTDICNPFRCKYDSILEYLFRDIFNSTRYI